MTAHRTTKQIRTEIADNVRAKMRGSTVRLQNANYHIVFVDDVVTVFNMPQAVHRKDLLTDVLKENGINFLTGVMPEIIYIQC